MPCVNTSTQETMHRAKRAIIVAAGVGARLKPITDHTPKPLVEVSGTRIIESVIDGLIFNNIKDIYIVTGHLKSQFSYLTSKYPVKLIENPYYLTHNNISSLYMAREYLSDCIICDGDQIINNKAILHPAFEASGYCSSWANETSEWLQDVDEDGFVKSCSRTGGKNGWQLYSVSFWTRHDGLMLRRHLEELFMSHPNLYWDDIPMFLRKDAYKLKIRPVNIGDIIEIDTLKELEAVLHTR